MSASIYQQLLSQVFSEETASLQQRISPLYQELEDALQQARPGKLSQELVSFSFERLRLGIGITLLQLLTDLGGDEDSSEVRDLLQDALEAASVHEIDKRIQKKGHLFEELYTDLYVNAEAEHVLALFERTLESSSKEETDEVLEEALELAHDLEIQPGGDEDDLA
ncbi:hypothetical protein TH61_01370 [Rufibacter sp. DG15C]|uniref:hypothetical protein n=1 Tax=Rufibacter sp. DG15C TaxID=1379909 RepID=UPI00078B2BB9|nr:hypothetical protein [Rufibacter sp. DG15C]AMM50094.1 hypothetical protein TH61_01370 [Rufibacter sp. DG15C]